MGGAGAEMPVTEKILRKMDCFRCYYAGKALIDWQIKMNEFYYFLEMSQLRAEIVTGEVNIDFYTDDIYRFIHQLADTCRIKPKSDKPRMSIVAGPIINVSETTGRSVVIELWREGFADIYFSPHRQARHYMIGGFNEREAVVEEPHSPIALPYRRKQVHADIETNPSLVMGCRDSFRKLVKSSRSNPVVPVKEESDLERFIFMTCGEIEEITHETIKDFGKNAFGPENEEGLNWHYFTVAMKILGIDRRGYPGPYQPKGQ